MGKLLLNKDSGRELNSHGGRVIIVDLRHALCFKANHGPIRALLGTRKGGPRYFGKRNVNWIRKIR